MSQSSPNNPLRIIAGQWRGRKLNFPAQVAGLRPTGDRIRETLFNWLAPSIHQSVCLDAFAGSGILGWEALSRGADHCVFIDQANAVVRNLKAQQAQLHAETCSTLLQADTCQWLQQSPVQHFDLVFIDPPFADTNLLADCVALLLQRHWLREGALIYIEQPASDPLFTHSALRSYRHKRAAQVQYTLLKYET